MTTILHSFREVAQQAEALDLQIKIPSGGVFWVQNDVLASPVFRFACDDEFHPVVVMASDGEWADVRVMTSKIDRNKGNGVIYQADAEVRLDNRPKVILTGESFHLRIPLTALHQPRYRGNVGPHILRWIRINEQLTNSLSFEPEEPIDADLPARELALSY